MTTSETKDGTRMLVVFEIGVSPLGVYRGSELSVVLGVAVGITFSLLRFSNFLSCVLVEDCRVVGRGFGGR